MDRSILQHAVLSTTELRRRYARVLRETNTYPTSTDRTRQRLLHRFPHQGRQFDQAFATEDQICLPHCELSIGQDPPSEDFGHVFEGFLWTSSVTVESGVGKDTNEEVEAQGKIQNGSDGIEGILVASGNSLPVVVYGQGEDDERHQNGGK